MPADQDFLDSLSVEDFAQTLDHSKFNCHEQIDWFLRNAAATFQEKRLSSVKCWTKDGELAGYMTTSMSNVLLQDGGQRTELDLKVPILISGVELKSFPALLIGMLGVCKRFEGRGLGQVMVRSAIGQAYELSKETGCRFVTVDADLTDRAIGMYSSLQFAKVKAKGNDDRRKVWMFYDLV